MTGIRWAFMTGTIACFTCFYWAGMAITLAQPDPVTKMIIGPFLGLMWLATVAIILGTFMGFHIFSGAKR